MLTPEEFKAATEAEQQYRAEYPEMPRVFDMAKGQFRDVTQKDVDDLMLVGKTYGALASSFIAAHQQLGIALGWPGFPQPTPAGSPASASASINGTGEPIHNANEEKNDG